MSHDGCRHERDGDGDIYAGLVERYRYTPYGEFVILKGDPSGSELGNVPITFSVGISL